ncbi:MAG: GNAT family N-acetyltransferase [Gammaproteobacteria bacterium]|jgi:ribosomal-protein-serine acetyltransferase|nr:GNAT family N-acetyltransferase [Gammaproteobacteria bacterium]MBT5202909.1 GNAT family N-acetyltransferase [Gammaproteobacteria bacterium]MBT5602397.1 GNAT family N-acetyltransferase [Gammaproteobacteria bacterium]MBT6245185.1 GNAT family N-acetyltransferase [Gammaproteobacteria bacterium]
MTNLSDTPPQFETKRLLIRSLLAEDNILVCAAVQASKPELSRFMPWCHPTYGLKDATTWITQARAKWQLKEHFTFVIIEKLSGQLIGSVGLNTIAKKDTANLGYWIHSEYCNRGFATESALGLFSYSERYLRFKRLEIVMSTRNMASRQVAINVKAQFEGTTSHSYVSTDENQDAFVYALYPEPAN